MLLQTVLTHSGAPYLGTGWTVMHDAARAGYKDMLQCLLHYGGDVTLRDSRGNTPAHTAALHGHTGIVRYLARAMDITRSYNKDGLSPLDIEHSNKNPSRHHRKWIYRTKSEYLFNAAQC